MAKSRSPLLVQTPDEWALVALGDPLSLLNDHAHLERKAAQNVLELMVRCPEPESPERWISVMGAVARDEVAHLAQVNSILTRRGGVMSRGHRSRYAQELRKLVRGGSGNDETVDRLLVSALIEARSSERFEILARCCEDTELKRLYKALWSSEHGHYAVFLSLADDLLPRRRVRERWAWLLKREAEIIQRQRPEDGLHGWVSLGDERGVGQAVVSA